MSSRRRGNKDTVKVVIINTEYVETDARSFKSVVQNLTGKDSTISASATADQQPLPKRQPAVRSNASRAPVLSRGMSFNEFERMIKELSPFDEL
ncbi:hypothetical protein ACP275_08G207200 [Erythranthe tilingii]